MGKDLQIFDFNKHVVRVIVRNNDELWFVVNDVCVILEIDNPRNVITRLLKNDVCQADITDSLDRKQKTNMVNEAGLYRLIYHSTHPEKKEFRRWIASEVLPFIYKTGVYATDEEMDEPVAAEEEPSYPMIEEMKKLIDDACNLELPQPAIEALCMKLADQIVRWDSVERMRCRLVAIMGLNKHNREISEICSCCPEPPLLS